METVVILAVMCVASAVPIWYFARQQRLYQERIKRLRPPNTVFTDYYLQVRVAYPSLAKDTSQPADSWTHAILFVSNKHIVAYPRKTPKDVDVPIISILGHEIEGFWRPEKYTEGINRIEIHAIVDGQWTILRAKLTRSRMQALVRALKGLVDDDIIRAYRQRRPYVYHPPETAYLAVQDLYGMWEHQDPFTLYLTPATLVFMGQDDHVERVIKLRDIQNLRVVPPEETSMEYGLVCFKQTSTLEDVAVAVKNSESWSTSIAQAARRTLEEPVTRKGKLPDVDSDWDSDFDMEEWESLEYVLGDDGELQPRKSA